MDDEPFTCTVDDDGDAVVLRPVGELDASTAPVFREVAHAAVLRPRTTGVEVDLSGVDFLDSSGLREFIDASRIARSRDIPLRLTNAQPRVHRTFVLVGLERHLELG